MFFIFETILGAIYNLVHRQRSMSMGEVNEALEKRAVARFDATKEKLDWQTSIVDLLKLLDLESEFQARRKLAEELGFSGTFVGTAEQNRELHKLVMAEVGKRCISIPPKTSGV